MSARSPTVLPALGSRTSSRANSLNKDPLLNDIERESELTSRKSSVVYDEYNGNAQVIYEDEDKETYVRSLSKASAGSSRPEMSWREYLTTWTEDGAGLIIAFVVFVFTTVLAFERQNIEDYSQRKQWPLGMAAVGFFVVVVAHFMLKKNQELEAYGAIIVIAVAARAIGEYNVLKSAGLSASFWAIILGILFRYVGLKSAGGVLSGEFFIKIGVTLLAMDFSNIAKIGLPGLMVAWGDTMIVIAVGTMFAIKVMGMNLKDSLVVAGATSICGSSAATAISAAIHVQEPNEPPYVDKACSTVIALMGMLNTPLMPLLPLIRTRLNVNPVIVGSWIGGSVDSTGQVIASASLGGSAVLESATIIKMAQNVLIGPVCLALTVFFQKSFKPSILLDKFPLFVVGFFVTSLVANIIRLSNTVSEDISDLIISNSWFISEWINLVGFARIGLQIDVNAFIKNSEDHTVLYTYLAVQCLDLLTTFGWSYLLFLGASYEDDDEV